ncbi:glycosyltransferase family 4 protein [Prevotella copri]|uniref:Glycosyltransferase family 4 protein n=1 Tax=Segatella copri TaxID=165179 RepID=A0AAP3F9B0_9BACT|nr:glycosyltransferase family 4 protein [Segatella copri]MCW4129908.1 glycosyltransferase family 4 protein [Segatella copri]MCW4415489.1 glycosyltransferase family 4 protein [Segatella copri]MCW4422570.1 glycosyltransferase family 4 protein [Segatella copri]
MKVLLTIPCLLTGGTEIQTLNLVRALIQGGHQVTTACYFEHTENMVKLYEDAGSKVVLFSKEGVRLGGVKGILFLLKNLWKIRLSLRPDVVHVQYMAPGAIPIILLKLMGQRNIVATAHTNADVYGTKAMKLLKFLQGHVLRAFTCITLRAEKNFFGSCSLFDSSIKHIPDHAHYTIYNALPGYIQISDNKKENNDIITIGVVSRLEHIKGMDLVVPAFAKVYEKNKNIRLLVVGDGSLRHQMEEDASRSHLCKIIEFAGMQQQRDLQSYYDKIDVLLMPSRSEGFGLTAIEGMARGCVLVASNTGGLPEVVREGYVGLLHQPESVDDLANKICSLIENPKLLEQMRSHLSDYVHQFTFERYADLFNDLYSKLK